MADFDKNMILPHVPCGHFALSTLSETCLKDVVFEINVTSKFHKKNVNIVNVKFETKIKNRNIFKYYVVYINTF